MLREELLQAPSAFAGVIGHQDDGKFRRTPPPLLVSVLGAECPRKGDRWTHLRGDMRSRMQRDNPSEAEDPVAQWSNTPFLYGPGGRRQ